MVLREDRNLFKEPSCAKPWWHPSRWGSDVELSAFQVAVAILMLTLGTAIAWFLVVNGAALLPPIRLN